MRRTHILLAIALGLLTASCGEADSDSPTRIIVDGVPTLSYPAEHAVPLDPYHAVASVVFGERQSQDTYMLSGASPVGRAEDGSVFILDSRERLIHRFAADGQHLGAFGGRGEGPGEFSRISSGDLAGGQILAWDGGLLRLNRFNTQGRLLSSTILPSQAGELRRLTRFLPATPDVDSPLIALCSYGSTHAPGPAPTKAEYEAHLHVYLMSPTLEILNVLVDSVAVSESAYLGTGNSVHPVGPPVYGRAGAASAIGVGTPLAWTFDDRMVVNFLDPLSGERWATTIAVEPEPVSQADREAAFARWDDRDLGGQARRYLVFAENRPVISSLQWDTKGRLWVRGKTPDDGADAYFYWVLNERGEWLFTQRLPASAWMFDDGGFFSAGEADPEGPTLIYYLFSETH